MVLTYLGFTTAFKSSRAHPLEGMFQLTLNILLLQDIVAQSCCQRLEQQVLVFQFVCTEVACPRVVHVVLSLLGSSLGCTLCDSEV